MKLTNRNHSNPCFWTVLWNRDYLDNVISGSPVNLRAREQTVYSLNVRADKIVETSVDNVHVDKGIGVAEMEPDAMKQFCKRYFPEKYDTFVKEMERHPKTLLMPFEQVLDSLEKSPAYEKLLAVVAKENIENRDEIAYLSAFIMFQHSRSHALLRSTLERTKAVGMEAFEYFWLFRRIMGNPDALFMFMEPLATSQWLIYRTADHAFPLPDTPVLIRPTSVIVSLSPRLLAEIRLDTHRPEGCWVVKSDIPKGKLGEYRRRAISSTFKELIFGNRSVLEEWQATPEFRRQVKLVRDVRSYSSLLEHALQRPLYPDSSVLRNRYQTVHRLRSSD